jgi:hypothetical protein
MLKLDLLIETLEAVVLVASLHRSRGGPRAIAPAALTTEAPPPVLERHCAADLCEWVVELWLPLPPFPCLKCSRAHQPKHQNDTSDPFKPYMYLGSHFPDPCLKCLRAHQPKHKNHAYGPFVPDWSSWLTFQNPCLKCSRAHQPKHENSFPSPVYNCSRTSPQNPIRPRKSKCFRTQYTMLVVYTLLIIHTVKILFNTRVPSSKSIEKLKKKCYNLLQLVYIFLSAYRIIFCIRFIHHNGPKPRKYKERPKINRYKSFTVRVQCNNINFVIKSTSKMSIKRITSIVRQYCRLSSESFIAIFDESGTQYYSYEWVNRSMHLVCRFESTFGATEPNASEITPHTMDDPEYRERQRSSLSILYSNVSGGMGSRFNINKKMAIKACSMQDAILALNETNCVASDAMMLANCFGTNARVSDCSDCQYKNGTRYNVKAGARKLSGFGTAIIDKDRNLLDFVKIVKDTGSRSFEIVPALLSRGMVRGLIISAYRSPSMTDTSEISEFYKQIHDTIALYETQNLAFYIVMMDDNKTCSSTFRHQERMLLRRRGMRNLIGHQITRMRSSSQPDSILAKFDPFRCTVSAAVISQITEKMDHNAIRIHIGLIGVPPRLPIYRNVKRRVRIKDDGAIGKFLDEQCRAYCKKYNSNVKSDCQVDSAAHDLYEILHNTKKYGWNIKIVRLPDCITDKADKWTVKIGMEHAKMERIGLRLQESPDNREALDKFLESQQRCLQYIAEKRDADCDRDLKYNDGRHGSVQTRSFYRWCDKFASNKSSYRTEPIKLLSDSENSKKLKDHDSTFISEDPKFKCTMSDMTNIESERRFSISDWDPDENPNKLIDFIRSRPKIDPFYKINAAVIAKPLFRLLQLIDNAEYFPKCMRTSRATFIPGRTIFSLEALIKIIESVLSIEFGSCTLADFEEHGDPEGFAYRKGRSVLSCMAVTLTGERKMVWIVY